MARVSLFIGASFEAAWESVLLPWFELVATHAFQNQEPVAVATPLGSHSAFLRAKLLDRRISLIGVKFLSPPALRELMLRNAAAKLPLREHLRLLLSIAAEEYANSSHRSDHGNLSAIAKSVTRAPDHLLRVIDQLSAAGWSLENAHSRSLRKIAENFWALVRECGFQMVHEADRLTVTAAEKSPPRFSDLLITGFNAAHWPLWPLLRAAVISAEKATVLLTDPRDEARDLDETWVGTWEEAFRAAQPIPAEAQTSGPLAELTRLPEATSEIKAHAAHPQDDVLFFVGRDATEQAKAIVALTTQFLSEKSCERIGILFPGSGALHRLVATLLEETKISHSDGIGHLVPNPIDGADWRAWMELQENPRLNVLIQFLRASENEVVKALGIAEILIDDIEQILRRAFGNVLIDDIGVLSEYCARQTNDDVSVLVAKGLNALRFLPEHASLPTFLSESRSTFEQFGWRERWSEVNRLSRNWSDALSATVSRPNYLRWLAEISCTPVVARDECGNHPYSRVRLLQYAAAEGLEWSHLIFAGLNEGEWSPHDDESGFVREKEITDLNRGIRRLNRSAIRQGRHGEGQWSVEEGKTFYLGAAERREIAQRQFFNLIESARTKIGVTASLFQDSAPERTWNPSNFFLHLYFAARGRVVSQETMNTLEQTTRTWLQNAPVAVGGVGSGVANSNHDHDSNLVQTRVAYDVRRQPGKSSQYEFTLLKPLGRTISLRVTDWENALRTPALVWMRVFLGVEPNEEVNDGWSRSIGQWVHHWLAHAAGATQGNQFVELPSTDLIRTRLFAAAKRFHAEIEQLCKACGRRLPDWWQSSWSNALYVADRLAANLSGLDDWSNLATEWQLGSPEIISLGEKQELRLRGRIDLILARGRSRKGDASDLTFADLWVIDYKTGTQRGFNLRELGRNESPEEKLRKQFADGKGVQLALYALALRMLGASSVQLTLLTPAGELEPQFHLNDVIAQKDFWHELYRMQESGVFGMLGEVRPEYGITRVYPLATLAIGSDLLKEKWMMTHPAFAIAEDGAMAP